MKNIKLELMIKIGVLSAVAFVIMLFEIPLWFAPSFYKIDLSEVIVLIGGFALGVVPAILIELIKNLINVIIRGSSTAGVGELANFLIGVSMVLPAVVIFRRKLTLKYAIVGLFVGTIFMVIIGGLLNAYVLLPIYAKVFIMPIDALVEMGSILNPAIKDINGFILLAVTPFNLLKGILTSILTSLLYKNISVILIGKKYNQKNNA